MRPQHPGGPLRLTATPVTADRLERGRSRLFRLKRTGGERVRILVASVAPDVLEAHFCAQGHKGSILKKAHVRKDPIKTRVDMA
jgi:hypothetical protein